MSALPGFTIRADPAFRPARLIRVLVSPDALYFIRMKGLISPSDAGGTGPFVPRRQAAVASVIRQLGHASLASGLAEVERSDPEELVCASKKHFKIPAADFVASNLDPPPLFGGQGVCYARWKVVAKGHKNTYQIEDAESLETAWPNSPDCWDPC